MIYVIGSGIIGLAIGYKLIKNGYPVEIFCASRQGESSQAAVGMLAPLIEFQPYKEKLLKLMIESNQKWQNFSSEVFKDSGIDIEYKKNSSLLVGNNEDDLRQMEFKLKKLKIFNSEFSYLTRNQTLDLEPNLSRFVNGSFLIKNQDQINPISLKSSLKEAFLNLGGKINENQIIKNIEIEKKIINIQTIKKKFSCTKLIFATGAWTKSILNKSLNINLPIRPVKGVSVELNEKKNKKKYHHNLWFKKIYLAPRINGNLSVGATEEDVGFETTVTLDDMFFLIKNLWEAVPLGKDYNLINFRAGLRPTTFDGNPIIGILEKVSKNIICAVGHYRNGILLAPETADLVYDLIKKKKIEHKFLSPNRF